MLGFNWAQLGIPLEKITNQIDHYILPIVFRSDLKGFQLRLYLEHKEEEQNLLERLSQERKVNLGSGRWLVLLTPRLGSEEVTYMRDHLWLNTLPRVARLNGLSPDEIIKLVKADRACRQAALRLSRAQKEMERSKKK